MPYRYISHLTDQLKFGPCPSSELCPSSDTCPSSKLCPSSDTCPDKNILNYLNNNNFLILDLRSQSEHTPEYEYNYNPNLKYNFFIEDRRVPTFEELTNIVNFLHQQLYDNKFIYIHCRGGHGRAGLVAGALYGKAYNLNYEQVMLDLKKSHDLRLGVNSRWRKLGIPQTKEQKDLLKRFLSNK